jgi:hypothetical protein
LRIAESSRPIVAGPWIGDVGLELLYWIPILQWLTQTAGVDPDRIVAVSRGGADPWYSDVAARYIDLLDHFGPQKLHQWRRQRHRVDARGGLTVQPADRRAFELARKAAGEPDAEWLHPSLVDRLFEPRWRWGAGLGVTRAHTVHRPLATDVPPPSLEQPYVALDLHFSPCFPDTSENRSFAERLIAEVSSRTRVEVLWDPEGIEGYQAFAPDPGGPAHALSAPLPRQNLAALTQVVRHAELLISTYGGLSYLGPYLETPTVAFYSRAGFPVVHLDEIERVGRELATGSTRLFRARHVGHLSPSRPSLSGASSASPEPR